MSSTTSNKPLFIAFEGMDGSGKSSISKEVAKKMGAAWHATPPVCFSDIRCKIDKEYKRSGLAAQLFYASSVVHASQMVKDEVNDNKQSVVLDRYVVSTIAYDKVVRDSGLPDKLWIYDIFRDIAVPDIILYLHVSPEVRQRRMVERDKKNNNDIKSIDMTKKLSARYDNVLSQFQEEKSWNIAYVSNEDSQDDCVRECLDKIEKL